MVEKMLIPEQGEMILIPAHHRSPDSCVLYRISLVVPKKNKVHETPHIRTWPILERYNRKGRLTMTGMGAFEGPLIPLDEIEVAKQTLKMRLWRLKHTTSKIQREVPNGG